MAPRNDGQPKGMFEDPALLAMFVFVSLYIAALLTWAYAHRGLSQAYTYIRYVEAYLPHIAGYFAPLPGLTQVHDWVLQSCGPTNFFSGCTRDFGNTTWTEISDSSFYFNLVILVFLVILSIRFFFRADKTHPKLRFSRVHNIKTFVEESKALYPHLRFFSQLNLIPEPLDHPVFGMSFTSRQFAYKYRLIAGWKAETDGTFTPLLDLDAAERVFRAQLGKLWTRVDDLTAGEAILMAIALPRVAGTDPLLDDVAFAKAKKTSEDLILWCWSQFRRPSKKELAAEKKAGKTTDSLAWLRPTLDVTEARRIIREYLKYPAVRSVFEKHAYVRTILFALYRSARRLGVLAPADVRWLRYYDRPLWYALQSIDRQGVFAEASGIQSHYLYECKAQSGFTEPQLDKAVKGIEVALLNYKYLAADKKRYEALAEE